MAACSLETGAKGEGDPDGKLTVPRVLLLRVPLTSSYDQILVRGLGWIWNRDLPILMRTPLHSRRQLVTEAANGVFGMRPHSVDSILVLLLGSVRSLQAAARLQTKRVWSVEVITDEPRQAEAIALFCRRLPRTSVIDWRVGPPLSAPLVFSAARSLHGRLDGRWSERPAELPIYGHTAASRCISYQKQALHAIKASS